MILSLLYSSTSQSRKVCSFDRPCTAPPSLGRRNSERGSTGSARWLQLVRGHAAAYGDGRHIGQYPHRTPLGRYAPSLSTHIHSSPPPPSSFLLFSPIRSSTNTKTKTHAPYINVRRPCNGESDRERGARYTFPITQRFQETGPMVGASRPRDFELGSSSPGRSAVNPWKVVFGK